MEETGRGRPIGRGIMLLKLIGNTLGQRRYRLADGWLFVG